VIILVCQIYCYLWIEEKFTSLAVKVSNIKDIGYISQHCAVSSALEQTSV